MSSTESKPDHGGKHSTKGGEQLTFPVTPATKCSTSSTVAIKKESKAGETPTASSKAFQITKTPGIRGKSLEALSLISPSNVTSKPSAISPSPSAFAPFAAGGVPRRRFTRAATGSIPPRMSKDSSSTVKEEDESYILEDGTEHDESSQSRRVSTSKKASSSTEHVFPGAVLQFVEKASQSHPRLVKWDKSGKGFFVNASHAQMPVLMRKYFSHGNYASFRRQLNVYGWTKVDSINRSTKDGMWYHPCFHRDPLYRDLDGIERRQRNRVSRAKKSTKTTSKKGKKSTSKKKVSQSSTVKKTAPLLSNSQKKEDVVLPNFSAVGNVSNNQKASFGAGAMYQKYTRPLPGKTPRKDFSCLDLLASTSTAAASSTAGFPMFHGMHRIETSPIKISKRKLDYSYVSDDKAGVSTPSGETESTVGYQDKSAEPCGAMTSWKDYDMASLAAPRDLHSTGAGSGGNKENGLRSLHGYPGLTPPDRPISPAFFIPEDPNEWWKKVYGLSRSIASPGNPNREYYEE